MPPLPPYADAVSWARFVAQVIEVPGRCPLWTAPPRDEVKSAGVVCDGCRVIFLSC
jgi:hypothetical protein